MSRFGDGDDYEPIVGRDGKVKSVDGLWRANLERHLRSPRGQALLRDVREALLALPEHRLIEGALCTVGLEQRIEAMPATVIRRIEPVARDADGRPLRDVEGRIVREPERDAEVPNYLRTTLIEYRDEHEGDPEGVCFVGAYIWHRKVRGGLDPDQAFAELPVLPDTDGGAWGTAEAGREAGLTDMLATQLAWLNDNRWEGIEPEQRWQRAVGWIDERLVAQAASHG